MAKLTAARVTEIFMDCLFKEGEDTTNHVPAPGIMQPVGFNPERIEKHRAEIKELLAELPDNFMKNKGGGWTFLNMCTDKNGEQWGEHPDMEKLVQLGEGTEMVKCLVPRDLWSAMPGGMPYYSVEL